MIFMFLMALNDLTMNDTNMMYTATKDMVLDDSTNTFSIATDNAVFGDVLAWNGYQWAPGLLDQFTEMPLSQYASNLLKTKRLTFDQGNVAIGTSNVYDYPFLVQQYSTYVDSYALINMVSRIYNDPRAPDDDYFESSIRVNVDPVGLYFNGELNDWVFHSQAHSYLTGSVGALNFLMIKILFFCRRSRISFKSKYISIE